MEDHFLTVCHDLAVFDGHFHGFLTLEIIGDGIHAAHGDIQSVRGLQFQLGDGLVQPQVLVNHAVIGPADGIHGIQGDAAGAVQIQIAVDSFFHGRKTTGQMQTVLTVAAAIVHFALAHRTQFPGSIQIQQVIIRAAFNHGDAAVTGNVRRNNREYLVSNLLGDIFLQIQQAAAALEGDGIGTVTCFNGQAVLAFAHGNHVITSRDAAVFRYGNFIVAAAGRNMNGGIGRLGILKFRFQRSVILVLQIQLHIGGSGGSDVQHIVTVTGIDRGILHIRQGDIRAVPFRGTVISKVLSVFHLHVYITLFGKHRLNLTLVCLLLLQCQVDTGQKQLHILNADAALQLYAAGTVGVDGRGVHRAVTVGRNGVDRIGCRRSSFGAAALFRLGFRAAFFLGVFIRIMGNDVDDDALFGISVFVDAAVVNDQAAGIGAILHHNGNVLLTGSNRRIYSLLNGIDIGGVAIIFPFAAVSSVTGFAFGTAFSGSLLQAGRQKGRTGC